MWANNCCCYVQDKLLHAQQTSKTCKCPYPALCVQVSKPLSRMETTRECYSSYLLMKLIELHAHNLLSVAVAAVAMVFLIQTSAVLVPALERNSPKNVKLVTSASFSPFMVMSALVLFVLYTMIFDFSRLTSIQFAPALSKSMLVSMKLMSFENLKLGMDLPLMEIYVSWSRRVTCIICSRNILNTAGESRHP
ncbi:hypothetical protein DPMN_022934 [Dreissena polymorpha]|uniref:Uncharacterized protein n=1 Tax=Dreissena polymorpha TaxID=45954 RepID=A0A9D4R9H0_DREPO|nr:hypothetical protein DPMN_022934 [Dreissena polymorpha]